METFLLGAVAVDDVSTCRVKKLCLSARRGDWASTACAAGTSRRKRKRLLHGLKANCPAIMSQVKTFRLRMTIMILETAREARRTKSDTDMIRLDSLD